MAKVAEGIARVVDGIENGRRHRKELAVEIKALTMNRRGEVRSMLQSMMASRGRAGREQAEEARRMTKSRHREVRSILMGMQTSRGKASREHHREAMEMNTRRRREIRALLAQFGRELATRRQHRKEMEAAQRQRAAAFMRNLTGGVAALCEGFAKAGRERSAAVRARLALYGQERSDAVAIWRGTPRQAHHAAGHGGGMSHRPMEPQASQPEPRDAPNAPAEQAHATTQSQDSGRPGRRPFGNLGHKGSSDRHGGESK